MPNLPQQVSQSWDKHEGPVVFATVDPDGLPNAVYMSYAKKADEDKIVLVNNYFKKTRANIHSGSRGAVLFITPDEGSYQVKGSIEYLSEGALFEEAQKWVDGKHPCEAVAVLHVEEAYKGGERLL